VVRRGGGGGGGAAVQCREEQDVVIEWGGVAAGCKDCDVCWVRARAGTVQQHARWLQNGVMGGTLVGSCWGVSPLLRLLSPCHSRTVAGQASFNHPRCVASLWGARDRRAEATLDFLSLGR